MLLLYLLKSGLHLTSSKLQDPTDKLARFGYSQVHDFHDKESLSNADKPSISSLSIDLRKPGYRKTAKNYTLKLFQNFISGKMCSLVNSTKNNFLLLQVNT